MTRGGAARSIPPMATHPIDGTAHVVVAGGGMAGIEAALALREFAGDQASVTIVDPGRRFAIPASATGSAFGISPAVDTSLARVVARTGAALRRSHLVAIDGRRRLAMLAGGELVRYDDMIVAVGPRLSASIPEALTFRGHPDVEELRSLVAGVVQHAERGGDADVAVVIPEGCGWPLAGYEIAVMTREHLMAGGHGERCRVAIVTAEDAPLSGFGPLAGDAVVGKLRRTGIEIVTGSTVQDFDWGRLRLADGTTCPADRVISLPVTGGPALAGLPADEKGFVRCAPDGSVEGAPGVRIVGDAGAFPVKRGGIACQQADSVAASIARRLGAEVDELAFMPAMPEWVWDGTDGWLAREPADTLGGSPSAWWPVPKTAGRFLAPFLHELATVSAPASDQDPSA